MTTITVHMPIIIRRHGGRKLVIAPAGTAAPGMNSTRAKPALVKALARAHRWKRLLDTGRHATLDELAAAEKLDRSYLGKLLRLTLLAPDIVEAVMDGREPLGIGLPALLRDLPAEWQQQRDALHSETTTGTAPASRS